MISKFPKDLRVLPKGLRTLIEAAGPFKMALRPRAPL